jgi:DNA-binding FadR family transcriptional regulator
MTFKSASRKTLAESVVEQFLDQFRRGELKPGDRLPTERELMEQFGVGRSTVREALQGLARLNLIEGRPGVGTVVKSLDVTSYLRPDIFSVLLGDSSATELLEAREIIEVAIIGLAAQRANDQDLATLETMLATAEEALARGEPTYELSALFHVGLAQAAHNNLLLNIMLSLYELLRARGRQTVDLHSYLRWEIDSHRELFELVRNGDVEGARQAMDAHLRHAAHRLGEIADDAG